MNEYIKILHTQRWKIKIYGNWVDGSKYINPNRENYLDDHIHENTIRQSGIGLV